MITHESPLDVGIVGGGIGGLAAAAFLLQAGIRATVYEQAPELTEVGAGLIIAPNAARLLRRMGSIETFTRTAVKLDTGWEFRRWQDGTVLSSEDLAARCQELFGEETYAAHRADLLDAVKSAVAPESLRLGMKCTALDTSGPRPVLTFENGQTHAHDLVIGADGIHSPVRQHLWGSGSAQFSGLSAFRALVPADVAPEFSKRRAQVLWLGPGRHLVHYPVSSGRYINLVAFAPAGEFRAESWTATATRDEFHAEFAEWDPRIGALINQAERIGRWALLDRPPLTAWSTDRVTLLGDAAHPMFPFFAQGAAQSMEDAAVLALALAANHDDPAAGLQEYERIRLPRTTQIQLASHDRAATNHLPDGAEQLARDERLGSLDPLAANGWIYSYDPSRAFAEQKSSGQATA
ncbi:MAG: FAD-dependent monooxygenase [Leucobacter sp.]|nr:FAD-dependent monooxygenase [Leucobacter sp.]